MDFFSGSWKKINQYFTYIWTRPSKKFRLFNWRQHELRQQEHKEGAELCSCWGTRGGNKSKHHKHFRPGGKSSLHRKNEHTNLKPSTVLFSASKDKSCVPPWDALCLSQTSTFRTLLWGICFVLPATNLVSKWRKSYPSATQMTD